MRQLIALIILAVAATSAADAQPPDGMPAQDYLAIEQALQQVLRTRDPTEARWTSPSGANGSVMTRPLYQRGDRSTCRGSDCDDPCRSYVFTYTHPRMTGQSEFTGLRCLSDSSGRWVADRTETHTGGVFPIVLRAPAPPPPDPAVVARIQRIQRLLAELQYYNGAIDGDFGPGTQNAARAFVGDSLQSIDPATPSDALVAALQSVRDRSAQSNTCELVGQHSLAACGRVQ